MSHQPTDNSNDNKPVTDDRQGSAVQHSSKSLASTCPTWLVYLVRALIVLLVALALILVLLFYAMGTQAGTKFLLEKIITETGVSLKYAEGNLRDGVWVSDVQLAGGKDIKIRVNRAYVQMGFRALLTKQVHLVNSQIDTLEIINNKVPTGEPFDYATIDLPITLKIDNSSAKQVIYQQATKDPVYLNDIYIQDGRWSGTDIVLNNAKIRYDEVSVSNIKGKMSFLGDYPLDVSADVSVASIKKAHFGVLHTHATGTLKRTVGTLTSTYNGYDIKGEFIAQGLDDGTPFSAKLDFDKVVLPYADEQNITLKNGTITANGVVDKIELRIHTDLNAKDIPSGRYRARGVVYDDGLDVDFLQADTADGTLNAKGSMAWKDEFELRATLSGDGYRVRNALPDEYQEYQAYLPQTFTGDLGVDYFYRDDNNDSRFEFNLTQKDGEEIHATLAQAQDKPDAAWRIHADWQNLIRQDVPNLANIHSPHGSADVHINHGRTQVNARANIKQLATAPEGDYVVQATINNNERIELKDFRYDGVMGDLSGTGVIELAKANKPLSWQFDLATKKFIPNAYFKESNKTPFDSLSGKLYAIGRMRHDPKTGADIHDISIKRADLAAILTDKQTLALQGASNVTARIKAGDLQHFDASFDGDVQQSFAPQLKTAKVGLDVSGNLSTVAIERLQMDSDAGKLSATGNLNLTNGIDWDIKAKLDSLNTKHFVGERADLVAVVTGDLTTSGRYQQEKLSDVQVKFEGNVGHDKLPQGKLNTDIVGQGQKYTIKNLDYQGDAGELNATGVVDVTHGYAWDVKAKMNRFNVGAFIKDMPSELTGQVDVQGDWQKHTQSFAINHADVQGTLRNQPFSAKGALVAELSLPDDLTAYFKQLKTQKPKNIDELLALRGQIDERARRTQNIIKRLDADDLRIHMGDNDIHLDGDKSKLTTSLSITNLSQILPKAEGAIKGGVILMDDGNSLPTLYADVVAAGVRTADAVIQEARVLAKVVNLGNSTSQMLVDAKDIIVMGQVIKSARLDFYGTEQQHTLSINTQSTENQVNAKVAGGLDRESGRYRGVLSDGALRTKFGLLSQRQPTEFGYNINDGSIAVAAHCWQTTGGDATQGSLCLQDTLRYAKQAGNVNLAIQNLDTSIFSAILPQDIEWQSVLNGKVQANWQQGQNPNVNAVLYSDNGRVALHQDGAHIKMPYERVSVIAQSVTEGLKLRVDMAGSAARGYADVVVNPYQEGDKPISGALLVNDINLAVLRPFFPNFQALSGVANIAGGLGGTLKKPLFYGNAALENGALSVVDVPMNLSNINATMQVRGMNAQLSGNFSAGAGIGRMTGELDWSQILQARLHLTGDELDINHPPLLSAKVSPDIEVIVKPTEKYIDIQGVVSVPSATIRPPETTAQIVTESGDVTVLDRRAVGDIDKVLAVSKPWSINANLGLDLGDDVVFRGLGAKLPLVGALHLTQAGQDSMRARGVIQVAERTTIDGIGQNLELNYAQIRFNGDVTNPRLSIEGEKQIEGQTVGVRVKGTANNPDITVFNDAGLTEQQAMNALVTGRITESADSQISEQGFRSQITNNLAAAGLNLGLSGTRDITNQIGEAFGLEGLTIDASGNSHDTNVSVTGYISPDLYIRYGVGLFSAESALSMRYQLTRRIYIEAASAVENTVDVIYRWKF